MVVIVGVITNASKYDNGNDWKWWTLVPCNKAWLLLNNDYEVGVVAYDILWGNIFHHHHYHYHYGCYRRQSICIEWILMVDGSIESR